MVTLARRNNHPLERRLLAPAVPVARYTQTAVVNERHMDTEEGK